jgi:hypothetical protein
MIKHIAVLTPFFNARKYVNMNPRDCLYLDEYEFDKLNDLDIIVFHIQFQEFNIHENREISVEQVKYLLRNNSARIRTSIEGKRIININRNCCNLSNL